MKKRTGKIIIIAIIAAVILLITLRIGSSVKSETDYLLVGVCQKNMTDSWQIALNADITNESFKYKELKCIFSDAGDSIEKQESDIENMILRKADLLIITLCDNADLSACIQKAKDNRIPVIIIGELNNTVSGYSAHIFADNYKMGIKAGEASAKLLNGKGTILELQGDPGSAKSNEIKNGFNHAISMYPGIRKKYVVAGYWTADSAMKALKQSEIFKRDYRIDLIFSHNNEMLFGAKQYIRSKGINQKLIGIDNMYGSSMDTGQYKLSNLSAYVVSHTGGAEAIQYGTDLIKGKTIPAEIELETDIIYCENQ